MKRSWWDETVRRVRGRLSLEAEGQHYSEDMETARPSISLLLRSFTQAIEIMARENKLLERGATLEATALLPEKKVIMEGLSQLIARTQAMRGQFDHLPESLKQVQVRFSEVADKNRLLLQQAMVTQDAIMKILVESAVEDTRHGYSRTGEVGADISRAALSLNDRV